MTPGLAIVSKSPSWCGAGRSLRLCLRVAVWRLHRVEHQFNDVISRLSISICVFARFFLLHKPCNRTRVSPCAISENMLSDSVHPSGELQDRLVVE